MNARKLFITVLSFVLLMCAVAVKAQEATTKVSAYTPPVVTISGDTTVVRNCQVSTRPVVHLTAKATQGSTPVRYVWTTEAGTIEGNGATATWTLDGVAPGYYRANLEALSGSSNDHCQVFASTLVLVECPPAPECPQLSISGPSLVEVGKPVEFISTVNGTVGNSPLVYNCTVSAGTIIEGQGTSSIRVSTAGLEGQSITASASLAGYDASSARCSASFSIPIPITQACRKFDEYPEISRNEEKARLDNLGVALQNDPFATAYVIVHPAEHGKPGDVDKRSHNVTDYLINSRGMDAKRIVVQIGSVRPDSMVEIWLCPRGITPPR
jgi:hypothetical protein